MTYISFMIGVEGAISANLAVGSAEMSGETLIRRRGTKLKQRRGLPYGRHLLPLVRCCIRKIICEEADIVRLHEPEVLGWCDRRSVRSVRLGK